MISEMEIRKNATGIMKEEDLTCNDAVIDVTSCNFCFNFGLS